MAGLDVLVACDEGCVSFYMKVVDSHWRDRSSGITRDHAAGEGAERLLEHLGISARPRVEREKDPTLLLGERLEREL